MDRYQSLTSVFASNTHHQWYNLDSLNDAPLPVSNGLLEMTLSQLENEGGSSYPI